MKRIMFSATWCGNCGVVKGALDKAGIAYEVIDADSEEGASMVKQYGVRGLPTVLLLDEVGTEIKRVVGTQPTSAYL